MKRKPADDEEMILTCRRKRKKSKYLSPPYTVMVMRSTSFNRTVKADPPSEAFNDSDPREKIIDCCTPKIPKMNRTTRVEVIRSLKQDSGRENEVTGYVQEGTPALNKATLLIRFTPDSTYPSKEKLVHVFCEFGQVNEAETEVVEKVGCARVVFVNSADCEKAFYGLDNINLLDFSVASHRLLYHSSSSSKARATKPISHPTAGDVAAGGQALLECIKKNLDCIVMILNKAGPGGQFSSEIRSSLMEEFGGLLEKITNLLKSSTS